MGSRPVLGVIYILQGAEKVGVDTTAVLARFGIDRASLDPSAEIERSRELQILSALAEAIEDPAAGLEVGAAYGLAGYGPLVMLLLTCESAYKAILEGVRYQSLTYLFGELTFHPGAQSSALTLRHAGLPETAKRFRIDGEAAGTYKLLRDLQAGLGVNIQPEKVEMPYPQPPEAQRYRDFFHAPVQFGSDAVRFWIRNEHLSLRFPAPDAAAHSLYKAQCDQLLIKRRQLSGALADRVRQHLELFSGALPSAAEVARAFGIAERTLRRQLSAESTSLRSIVDAVRFTKAARLLENSDQSVETIALTLGYAEPASFIRAFQRWSGAAPARYRRDFRQQAAKPQQ